MDRVCIRYDYFVPLVITIITVLGLSFYFLFKQYEEMSKLTVRQLGLLREFRKRDEAIQSIPPPEPIQPAQPIQPIQMIQQLPIPLPISPYDRRVYGDFQLVGYAYRHGHKGHGDNMFRLMGRQIGGNKYEYYVIHPDNDIKIPISVKNDWELNTGDTIDITGFSHRYTVNIYDQDHPF
jgi:hypothetical protein